MASAKKLCLILRPTGGHDSEVNRRGDLILRYLLTPVLEECGYLPIRADKLSDPGLITSQLIQRVLEEPLVIADLTGLSPEVFYALALRHAARKPLVQIVRKGEKVPFDVVGMKTIAVDHTDLESVHEAKAEIVKQIKSIEGKTPEEIDSPVSVATQLQHLSRGNIGERSLLEVVSFMNDLREDLSNRLMAIEARLDAAPPADRSEYTIRRAGGPLDRARKVNEMSRVEELVAQLHQKPADGTAATNGSGARGAGPTRTVHASE